MLAAPSGSETGAEAACTALADLHNMVYPNTARWRKANGPALLRGLVNLDAARVRWRGGPPELVALRPLPSAAHVEAHAARWAARKHGS